MKHVKITITVKRNALQDAKKKIVRAAMLASRGNITHAARLLGVHRQSLQRLLG